MPPRKDPDGTKQEFKLKELAPGMDKKRLKGKRPSTPKGLRKVGENRFKLREQAKKQVKKSASS